MSYLFVLRIWKNVCAQSTRPQTSIGCLLYLGSETALHCKQAWFWHRNHYMGSGKLTEIIVCEHSSLWHPQIQVKYHEKWSPEKLLSSLGQNSFKIHLSKGKPVLWSDSSKFEMYVFLETMNAASSEQKKTGTIRLAASTQFKNQSSVDYWPFAI